MKEKNVWARAQVWGTGLCPVQTKDTQSRGKEQGDLGHIEKDIRWELSGKVLETE